MGNFCPVDPGFTTPSSLQTSIGTIRAGIGGWTFDAWNTHFYPEKLAKKRQLEYASRQLKTIEINGTYYRDQKPATFAKWAAETPDGFVFSLKANKFTTIKKVLAESGESVSRFVNSGITELGDRLGPILWQFAPTKRFDPDDFRAWLQLLPQTHQGVTLRHAVEVRHESFVDADFVALARKFGVAIVHADHETYPEIADVTADFVYSRLQQGRDDIATAYPETELDLWAGRCVAWRDGGAADDLPTAGPPQPRGNAKRDVFVYIIHGGKVNAPRAAMALQERVAAS